MASILQDEVWKEDKHDISEILAMNENDVWDKSSQTKNEPKSELGRSPKTTMAVQMKVDELQGTKKFKRTYPTVLRPSKLSFYNESDLVLQQYKVCSKIRAVCKNLIYLNNPKTQELLTADNEEFRHEVKTLLNNIEIVFRESHIHVNILKNDDQSGYLKKVQALDDSAEQALNELPNCESISEDTRTSENIDTKAKNFIIWWLKRTESLCKDKNRNTWVFSNSKRREYCQLMKEKYSKTKMLEYLERDLKDCTAERTNNGPFSLELGDDEGYQRVLVQEARGDKTASMNNSDQVGLLARLIYTSMVLHSHGRIRNVVLKQYSDTIKIDAIQAVAFLFAVLFAVVIEKVGHISVRYVEAESPMDKFLIVLISVTLSSLTASASCYMFLVYLYWYVDEEAYSVLPLIKLTSFSQLLMRLAGLLFAVAFFGTVYNGLIDGYKYVNTNVEDFPDLNLTDASLVVAIVYLPFVLIVLSMQRAYLCCIKKQNLKLSWDTDQFLELYPQTDWKDSLYLFALESKAMATLLYHHSDFHLNRLYADVEDDETKSMKLRVKVCLGPKGPGYTEKTGFSVVLVLEEDKEWLVKHFQKKLKEPEKKKRTATAEFLKKLLGSYIFRQKENPTCFKDYDGINVVVMQGTLGDIDKIIETEIGFLLGKNKMQLSSDEIE